MTNVSTTKQSLPTAEETMNQFQSLNGADDQDAYSTLKKHLEKEMKSQWEKKYVECVGSSCRGDEHCAESIHRHFGETDWYRFIEVMTPDVDCAVPQVPQSMPEPPMPSIRTPPTLKTKVKQKAMTVSDAPPPPPHGDPSPPPQPIMDSVAGMSSKTFRCDAASACTECTVATCNGNALCTECVDKTCAGIEG